MKKNPIHPAGAAKPLAPYTPAIEQNGVLYLSGQIALKGDTGELVMGSIEEETTQVMENIGLLLRAAGLGFGDLVKMTVLLSDMSLYGAVNAVYGSYFKEVPPAREAYAVKGLPRGVNVEISGIAVKS
ncbi:MAG: RidA family protein [Flavobacteriales bacterium]|nr:RidA family protein [Flavobacteriales bacterium]